MTEGLQDHAILGGFRFANPFRTGWRFEELTL